MSKSRVPWKSLLLLVIAVAAATVAFDVQKHGSFRSECLHRLIACQLTNHKLLVFAESITGRNLQRYGVIAAWNKSMAKATAYTAVASTWVSKNWPTVRAKVEPWVSAAGVQLAIGYKYVSEAAAPAIEPVRLWLGKTIPPLIAHVRDKLLPLAVSFVKDFSNAVIAVLIEVGRWIQENLLVGNFSLDNLSRIAADSVNHLHSLTGHAVNWITGHVKALTN